LLNVIDCYFAVVLYFFLVLVLMFFLSRVSLMIILLV